MLSIFSANEVFICQLNGSNFTAWYAEVFAAQISLEIDFFLPASELNPLIERMSRSLQTPFFACIFKQEHICLISTSSQ